MLPNGLQQHWQNKAFLQGPEETRLGKLQQHPTLQRSSLKCWGSNKAFRNRKAIGALVFCTNLSTEIPKSLPYTQFSFAVISTISFAYTASLCQRKQEEKCSVCALSTRLCTDRDLLTHCEDLQVLAPPQKLWCRRCSLKPAAHVLSGFQLSGFVVHKPQGNKWLFSPPHTK